MYKYILKNTGESSAKLGNCEICGKYTNEMYLQKELKQYESGWTTHECNEYLFGHRECLIKNRRDDQ